MRLANLLRSSLDLIPLVVLAVVQVQAQVRVRPLPRQVALIVFLCIFAFDVLEHTKVYA